MDSLTVGIIIAAFFLCGIIYMVLSARSANKRRREEIADRFGKIPDEDLDLKSIAVPWKSCADYRSMQIIDDTTWSDLDMDAVFERLDSCQTSLGEEYLYILLRRFTSEEEKERGENLMEWFAGNPDSRLKLQMLLGAVGKRSDNGLMEWISGSDDHTLPHPWAFQVMGWLPVVFLAVIPFNYVVAVILILSSFCVNIMTSFLVSRRIQEELPAVRYLSSVFWCCREICALKQKGIQEMQDEMSGALSKLRGLRSSVSGVGRKTFFANDVETMQEFGRMVFLHEIRSYNKSVRLVSLHRKSCETLCRDMAELDVAISTLSFRQSLPYYSKPHFIQNMQINVQAIYHPLLRNAVPNSITMTKATLITGSNASGKSTFIKAVAVNGILAMALNTCTARVYQAPRALVISSMAVRDNLTSGDSYFVSEIKSLKRVLDHVEKAPCLCFVDEILKGTNTAERIAASAAILQYLYQKDCLCLVATHDIELTEILNKKFENYHFSEQVTDNQITFDYLVKPGPSTTTNAIRLLSYMRFDRGIIDCAEKMVQSLQREDAPTIA